MGFLERFTNLVVIAVFTGFLIIPVAFLGAYPEAVPEWAGSLLADYCLRTGVCDFRILKAGLGVSMFFIITLFMGWLEALRPGATRWEVEDTLEEITGRLDEISIVLWDLKEEDREPEQEEEPKWKEARKSVAFLLAIWSMAFFMLAWWGSGKLPAVLGSGVVSAEIPMVDLPGGVLFFLSLMGALSFAGAVWHLFWADDNDKELFWERNFLIRGLYQDDRKNREKEKEPSSKFQIRKFSLAFSGLIISFFMATALFMNAILSTDILGWVALGLSLPIVAFDLYVLFMMVFLPDKTMFWEKNQQIQKLYQEDQSEPDQA